MSAVLAAAGGLMRGWLAATTWQLMRGFARGLAATGGLMRGSATAMDGGNAGFAGAKTGPCGPDCEELILALQLGCLPSMAATLRAITL